MLAFYDIVPSQQLTNRFISPNTWKTRLSLLHKGIQFRLVPMTNIEVYRDLSKLAGKPPGQVTCPAIQLEEGTFIWDSFQIAKHLDERYPEKPLILDERLTKLLDIGLGSGEPQWSVWFDLAFPYMLEFIQKNSDAENAEYFASPSRLGTSLESLTVRDEEALKKRAKNALLPIAEILKDGNFVTSKLEPGLVDYIIFGRYAMLRTVNPSLAKEVFDEVDKNVAAWLQRIMQRYPTILPLLP